MNKKLSRPDILYHGAGVGRTRRGVDGGRIGVRDGSNRRVVAVGVPGPVENTPGGRGAHRGDGKPAPTLHVWQNTPKSA